MSETYTTRRISRCVETPLGRLALSVEFDGRLPAIDKAFAGQRLAGIVALAQTTEALEANLYGIILDIQRGSP